VKQALRLAYCRLGRERRPVRLQRHSSSSSMQTGKVPAGGRASWSMPQVCGSRKSSRNLEEQRVQQY